MIPLTGRCHLHGEWPSAGTVLLRVEGRTPVGDGWPSVRLRSFYGAADPIDALGTMTDDSAGSIDVAHAVRFPSALDHLEVGDIVSINPAGGRTRVLFRAASRHNSFLVTERCDHYCLMCSQPPRNVNDEGLLDEMAATIPMLPETVQEIGFTGGEPTLRGARFVELLHLCKQYHPSAAVHVLTNGRRFADAAFAHEWAAVDHPDLMAGIPIYSDQSTIHDYVVQSDGAFDGSIRGILNLKRLRQRVEVRIVLHRHTIERIDRFAYFISRNLPFVDHVALMGLELMGFAKAHVDDLWIDPRAYAEIIADAAETLASAGLRVSIYNLPLCVLHPRARPFAIQSISDWKREYWTACDACAVQSDCGGAFFSSRVRLEPYIAPIARTP